MSGELLRIRKCLFLPLCCSVHTEVYKASVHLLPGFGVVDAMQSCGDVSPTSPPIPNQFIYHSVCVDSRMSHMLAHESVCVFVCVYSLYNLG